MTSEETLARWAAETTFEDIPDDVVELMKTLVFVIGGCVVAGGTADGCEEALDLVEGWGGKEEASVLVHGGRYPAQHAVLVNSMMARAYDICDFLVPGLHLGTSVVPVVLAVAEMVGGVSGRQLLTALAVSCEVGARLNRVSRLDGFDPSGVCGVLAAAVAAARLMGLDRGRMIEAMGLAFHRAGGSFQANSDGSLAVRLIQAFASQNGIVCATLAERGMTGGRNFIEGIAGYFHLYCNDERDLEGLLGDLGDRWDIRALGFKKYPSCGGAATSTDAALAILAEHEIEPREIEKVEVRMAGTANYRLVGHRFEVGPYPTVNAQFNASYCVANALLRGFPVIEHFAADRVTDPEVLALIEKVQVRPDLELATEHNPVGAIVEVTTRDGSRYRAEVEYMSGKGDVDPLPRETLIRDFWERSGVGGKPIAKTQLTAFLEHTERLDELEDARELVGLLIA